MKRLLAACGAAMLLAACAGGGPPPPEWQANAHGALGAFTSAYLRGNARLAELEFARARAELASTARADLVARAELTRCALRAASLEQPGCPGFEALAADAGEPERAYATYLTGRWEALQAAQLPAAHRPVVAGADDAALAAIEDPLSRLVAAGALFRAGRISPAGIGAAVQAASANGWRRPLLAWLGAQAKRAEDAGDRAAAAQIRRRMDLVSGEAR
jgi:hypothetical protein